MTEFDLLRPMTDTQRLLFQTEMLRYRKSVGVAAVLCFLVFGLHRFHLGQIGMGLLYAFTFGLFLIGSLVDLLRIKTLVERVNLAKAQVGGRPDHGGVHASPQEAPTMPTTSNARNRASVLILLGLLMAIGVVVALMPKP